MNGKRNTILVVDDQSINRKIITRQLEDTYAVLESTNGQEAIEILKNNNRIDVILLDLVMPIMDGFEFLKQLKVIGQSAIPVLVMTANDDETVEVKALQEGALDFVKKPVNAKILRSRIENALVRNQMVMLQRMEYIASHDSLTQLYNRNKMFEETRKMLDENPETTFALVRFDIDKFRMYNTAMGEKEGDQLLLFIGDAVRKMSKEFKVCTYGRVDADIFTMCEPYDPEVIETHVKIAQRELNRYRQDYALDTSFGIYVIDEPTLSVETMFTRASMAADKCKNLYEEHMAYYDEEMSSVIEREQRITNEMQKALYEEQFEVYLQPKYDLSTDQPRGAEALVRWKHPEKGLVSPGVFIPVFEKNGFIAKLDYYMWEHVCILIHDWLQKGEIVFPISVNMSRISLFNRYVDEMIIGLVKKYKIPPKLLNLEVTESAYMSNSELMGETIRSLQNAGFVILMDDFGSGYSSLNTLKEINIDVLKLDMKFMPNGEGDGKGEKIISSIVRMAGWLGMEVIAEGVETKEQKQFLESVGCGFVQGYYYAKPMPVTSYEKLMKENAPLIQMKKPQNDLNEAAEAIWSSNPQVGEILSSIEAPVIIFEYSSEHTEVIRINPAYIEIYGKDNLKSMNGRVSTDDKIRVKKAFDEASESGKPVTCEIQYITDSGACHWARMKARKVASIPKSSIICCLFEDITKEKLFENKLRQLVGTFDEISSNKKMLVVDDIEVSRAILEEMFKDKYEILEASNGVEALEILKKDKNEIAVILLDMIMPQMGGEAFLKEKNKLDQTNNIPVVVISSEKDVTVQHGMLRNGVSDYILKPFDFELTIQRVENARAYQSRFKQLVEEYRIAAEEES